MYKQLELSNPFPLSLFFFLFRRESILLLTSHSADFLNGVCSKIYLLTVRATLDLYSGNYDS